MTKRKLYWLLLIPSVLLFAAVLIYLSEGKKNYSTIIPLIYWVVYYILVKSLGLENEDEHGQ